MLNLLEKKVCRYPVWVAVLNRGLSAFAAVVRLWTATSTLHYELPGGIVYVPHQVETLELRNKMTAQRDERRVEVQFIPFRGYRHT